MNLSQPTPFDEIARDEPASTDASLARSSNNPQRARQAWIGMVLFVWLLGTVLVLLPLLLSIVCNTLLWIRSARVDDADWRVLLEEVQNRIGLRRRVDLLSSQRPLVPMTWGLLWPIVLLPEQARGWTSQLRRCVLLHELSHVKRWDVGFQMLARLACAMYWFHPLAWYAMRRLRVERELACDDCVLSAGEPPADYAQQLVEIARTFRPTGLVAAVAMAQGSTLEHRVRALLDRARSHLPLSPRFAASMLLASMVIVAGVAVVEPAAQEPTLDIAADASVPDRLADGEPENESSAFAVGKTDLKVIRLQGQVVLPNGEPATGATVYLPDDVTDGEETGISPIHADIGLIPWYVPESRS